MAQVHSPLRYPGGKSCLYGLLSQILRLNKLERGHYAEPYAGGSGLALTLLFEGHVSDIHLNDIDASIYSFWESVLNKTEALVELIEKTPVTMDEWHRQRDVYQNRGDYDCLQIGFATFFLNRTNRSGIVKSAGVIGGLLQTGNYKIDCRFNREELSRRIRRIAKYRSQIHLHKKDALDFMKWADDTLPTRSFLCIDPPYYNKGSSLYTSFYQPEDHAKVSAMVLGLNKQWVLTYDNVPEIVQLYRLRRQFALDVNYSLQTKRIGTELLIAGKGLRLPLEIRERQTSKPKYRATA